MRRLHHLPRSLAWPVTLVIVIVVSAASATAARKITGRDVENSSLTGGDIRNSSLSGADIRNRSLTARDFRESIRGPQGPQGPQGIQGVPGRNIAQLTTTTFTDPPLVMVPNSFATLRAVCPPDTLAVSGGYIALPEDQQVQVVVMSIPKSFANFDPVTKQDFWEVQAVNIDGAGNTAVVAAIANCAPAGAVVAGLRRRRSTVLNQAFHGALSNHDDRDMRGLLQPGQLP